MQKTLFISCVCALFFCSTSEAQQSKPIPTDVQITYAFKKGTTPPARSLKGDGIIDKSIKKKYYKSKTVPPRNFVGRYDNRDVVSKNQNQGPDKIRQTSFYKNDGVVVEPILNFEGVTSGSSPNDPTGDVGELYYMQAVNATIIAVYDKTTGELVDVFSGSGLWNSLGFNSGGDPIILYDQEVKRWIITEFPSGFGSNFNQLLVAISETSDPLGSYNVYNFNTPSFPDYPKYSVWTDSYAVTTNEQGPTVLHSYFINKEQLLAGEDVVTIQRVALPGNGDTEAGFFVATPVDWSGKTAPPEGSGPMLLALNDSSWNIDQEEDQIEVFTLELDWENPDNTIWSRLSLEVSPYDSYPCAEAGFFFSCIPQPGQIGLDGIPETIMHQSHYRNFGTHESIVLNFITDVTDGQDLAGIRWMELRRTSGSEWFVYQEGTFAPDDDLNRFMGGIAIDGAGNIALAYNVANANTFAGVRYTGRRAGDPLGIMTIEEYTVVDGSGSVNDGSRFGDYAHMTIDPVNDRTFWYTTEYGASTGSNTRIIALELTRDSIDLGILSFNGPQTGANLSDMETVDISIRNFGIQTVDSVELTYNINDEFISTEKIQIELEADSVYNHSFTMPADFSEIGDYDVLIYLSAEQDTAYFNDTLRTNIVNIQQTDIGLDSYIGDSELLCGMNATLGVVLENFGFDTIRSAVFELQLNGEDQGQFSYSGALPFGETEVFEFPIENLLDGDNDVLLSVVSVNMVMDTFFFNNTLNTTLSTISNGLSATLNLLFDDYPDETSWFLANLQGDTLASGGPYSAILAESLLSESFCLNPDSCYQFTILDSYEDGITFGSVTGNYEIVDDNGNVLAALINPSFGSEETSEFCATFECSIELAVSVSPSSMPGALDGFALVEVINGVGPFSFSIDGGLTVQDNGSFDELQAGRYTVEVNGANGCSEEIDIEIFECDLIVDVNITPESDIGSTDGQLEVLVNGEYGEVSYSIDGGETFVSESVFDSLAIGEYDIVVTDSIGCVFSETVRVGNTVSTEDLDRILNVKFYPNPTEGIFTIELDGVDDLTGQIPLLLYDVNGRLIQRSQLSPYSGKFKGVMSLYHYEPAHYFLRIQHDDIDRLYRIVRQ